jgi:hypothetical protein
MTTAYTPILKLALPVTGELNGTWGDVVNDNITSMVEQAVAGLATINTWTANSHTLTTADGTTSESRCAMLVIDDDGAGNPSAAATVICPTATKSYIVRNLCGQTVTVKTAAGTGVAIPNNQAALVFCDGTNVVTGSFNGDVVGPASATDDAIVRFDGTTGKVIQNSVITATDAGVISGVTQLNVDNLRLDGNTVSSTDTDGDINITPDGTGETVVGGNTSFTSTGSVKIPVGTTAQRPTPAAGMLRFNDDSDEFEGYNGTAWASVGGSAISNDTSTATDLFPSFLSATTGTAASIFTSNAKLLYKPSTGEFKSQQLVATNGIVVNSATVSADYTIPTGSNAMSAGPVTVSDGVTVTVSDDSNWVIL